MASLLVVTGPPGAGKSTVAAILASRVEPSVLVAGDDVFGFLARGAIAPWLPESHRQNEVVTQAAGGAAGRFAAGGFQTVYDGVVGPWFLPTFAAATGCDRLDYVVLLPPVERCLDRVATRVGHGFTDAAATRKMHREFAGADIDPRHLLVCGPPEPPGAPESPESVADRIESARAAGALTYEVVGRDPGFETPMFVVVSGPPSSGKSTIARPLAQQVGLPLVGKDTIKEALLSTMEVADVDASRMVGRAAVAAMFAVAAESPRGAVLDCNLHRSLAVTDLRALPGQVVEVFCRCDRAIALDRYRVRAADRAPGHFDADRGAEDIWHDDITEPVAAGWPVIEVDTNRPVDPSVVIARIRAAATTD